jgi:hypothetical protein
MEQERPEPMPMRARREAGGRSPKVNHISRADVFSGKLLTIYDFFIMMSSVNSLCQLRIFIMKTVFNKGPYCKIYNDILQRTDSVTFEQFIALHMLKRIDSRSVRFVISEDGFGHFEIEKNIPTYRYDMFFDHNYS